MADEGRCCVKNENRAFHGPTPPRVLYAHHLVIFLVRLLVYWESLSPILNALIANIFLQVILITLVMHMLMN